MHILSHVGHTLLIMALYMELDYVDLTARLSSHYEEHEMK
jgi:hypothetical protein